MILPLSFQGPLIVMRLLRQVTLPWWILFIGFISCTQVAEAQVNILVDGSGSMEGFFRTNSLQSWVERLSQVSQDQRLPVETKVFISKELNQPEWKPYDAFLNDNEREKWGNYTLLDWAFRKGRQFAPIVFLVTDNVQSSKDSDTKHLYVELNSPNVKKNVRILYFVPNLVSFDGKIYLERRHPLIGSHSLSDIHKKLKQVNSKAQIMEVVERRDKIVAGYQGLRGLVTYAILLDESLKGPFLTLLRSLRHSGEEELLLVQPITSKEINLVGEEDFRKVVRASRRPNLPRPNMVLKPAQRNGQLYNILLPARPQDPPHFRLDRRNGLLFYFSLRSRLRHVNINRSSTKQAPTLKIPKTSLKISAKNQADQPILNNSRGVGQVYPPRLVGELMANSRNQYFYLGQIAFGPFKVGFWPQVRLTPIHLVLRFAVQMTVPPEAFSLTESYDRQYFTRSPYQINRVYSPVDLIQYLSTQPVPIKMDVETR